MTIYIPLLYICMAGQCGFFQSENYTLDGKNCEQEIQQKKDQYTQEGTRVEAICVDVEIKLKKENHESERKLHLEGINQVRHRN